MVGVKSTGPLMSLPHVGIAIARDVHGARDARDQVIGGPSELSWPVSPAIVIESMRQAAMSCARAARRRPQARM